MPKQPIRNVENPVHQPYEPFWTFRDAVEPDGEPELELYGYISEYSWWEDDVTPEKFKADLQKYGQGGPITIRMNSYGGDVIAASLMSTIIRDYPGRVTVKIDGVAASAATVVAVAGDVLQIQETAYFMIHDPLAVFFLAALNIEELSRMVDSLKAIKEGIINAYETKTGMSRTRLAKLMTDETWMDAQKALDLGFVDEVLRAEKPIPVDLGEKVAVANALRNFVNVPANLLAWMTSEPDKNQQAADSLRAEILRIHVGGLS